MKHFLVILGTTLTLTSTFAFAETAGTVNGLVITVAEANKALSVLTKGQETWKNISKDKKKQLLKLMAPSKLIVVKSNKILTKKEKEAALSAFWMQKKMSEVEISDKETKEAYEKMKKMAKKAKTKRKIPSYAESKNQIKMQLAQRKVVSKLMKNAKIKIK